MSGMICIRGATQLFFRNEVSATLGVSTVKKQHLKFHVISGNASRSSFCTDTIRHEQISIKASDGEVVHLDAVIQDTLPSGSDVGTVVAMHGSPGSHKDFKYIVPQLKEKGIRFIGINFPGMGNTPDNEHLQHDNDERIQFVQNIIDRLKLQNNLVFMGHSRGSENSLKIGTINQTRTKGIVLINPIGLKTHRGIRPLWMIKFFGYIWNLGYWPRLFWRPIFHFIYTVVLNFKFPYGDLAGNSVRLMATTDPPSQYDYIQKINQSDLQVLIAYAGRDRFIEAPVVLHFAKAFRGCKVLECPSPEVPDRVIESQVGALMAAGERRIAVYFPKEDHWLQKHRAEFLALSICRILGV